jgi:hypothetical protein
MAENLRTGMVWKTLMSNPECGQAMELAGLKMKNGTNTASRTASRRKAGVLVAARS